MNECLKVIVIFALSYLCGTAMAADRFIVKYKLSESRRAFLMARNDLDAKKIEIQIRRELMGELSSEQIRVLSEATELLEMDKIQVADSCFLGNGAHVITLSKNLDEMQTRMFIAKVEQNDIIDYIEEDRVMELAQ